MIDITDVNRKFSMPVDVTRVDKGELLFLTPIIKKWLLGIRSCRESQWTIWTQSVAYQCTWYLEPVNTRNWKQKMHRKSASLVSWLPYEQNSAESSSRQERSLHTYQSVVKANVTCRLRGILSPWLGLSDTAPNDQCILNLKSSLCEIRRVGMKLVCPGEETILFSVTKQ